MKRLIEVLDFLIVFIHNLLELNVRKILQNVLIVVLNVL